MPSEQESAASDFQAITIGRVLRERLWLILCIALAGALLSFLFSKHLRKIYTSTDTFEVNRLSDTPLGTSTLNGTPQQFSSVEEMNASLLTNIAELQSASVAFAVIDQFHLDRYPPYDAVSASSTGAEAQNKVRERILALFHEHLKVTLVKDTKLVEVAFSDPDSYRAAAVANAVVNTYVAADRASRSSIARASTKGLTSQLADLRSDVLNAEKRVTDYKQQTGILGTSDIGTGTSSAPSADAAATDRMVELNRALTAAEVNLVQKEAIARATQNMNPDAILDLSSGALGTGTDGANPLSSERADLSLLASLRQQRSQLAITQASRANVFGSKSPQMLQLQLQIKEIDNQIRSELKQVRTIAVSDYQLAQANAAGLRHLVQQQQQTVTRMSVGGNQLLVLEQEASSDRKLYQDLFAKIEEANVSASIDSSSILVVDPARPSMTPSSPKTFQNVITGLVAGALLGIFLAFLLDYLRRPEPEMTTARVSTTTSGSWLPEREEGISPMNGRTEQTL